MNQEHQDAETGDATGVDKPGILRLEVDEVELAEYDWQQELQDLVDPHDRWGHVTRLTERARVLEAESPLQAEVLRLLSAVISMHLMVGTTAVFGPAIQMSGRRSAAPEDLDSRDLAALTIMVNQACSPWLRARLADVGHIAAKAHSVPAWRLGASAAKAYLINAKDENAAHPVERVESLQRAMELGWRYLRNDHEFHVELWEVAMELVRIGLTQSMPGISMPIAHEIVERNAALSAEAAELFEVQAETLVVSGPSSLAVDTFREAARLWHAAKNTVRAQAAQHRAADTLIGLARGPGQAMLQAENMLEGIAILRRHRGDRSRIRELQLELADIRGRITGEMSTISHQVDVSELVNHVKARVTSENLFDALLQVAFAFSQWTRAGEARQRVIESAGRYIFSNMFRQVTYDDNGVPVSVAQPFDASNEGEVEKRVIHDVAQFDHALLARVAIPCAIDILQNRFEPTMAEIVGMLRQSPVTPQGHEWSLARGLLAGLNHDWYEAAVFLIPQAEPFIRAAFKRHGIHTLAANAEGAEEEKSLNELLAHPEVSSVLSPDIVLELKAILTHKSGHNLRNLYGHGLMRDEHLANVGTIVLWWTMLRLILWPYRARMVELIEGVVSEGADEPYVAQDDGESDSASSCQSV